MVLIALRGATAALNRSTRLKTSILSTASRSLSTNPHVVVDKFVSSPPPSTSSLSHAQQQAIRHPNDVHDRNANYIDEDERSMAGVTATVRHNWTKSEIAEIYTLPFHELMYRASTVHRMYWDPSEVQQCTLL